MLTDPKRGGFSILAAIVENRSSRNLLPVILHFSAVLGPAWPIHVFKTPANTAQFESSAPIKRLIHSGGIVLHDLPKDAVLDTHVRVSEFLTRPWLWKKLQPASHVLLFQSDSILCGNSEHKVEDFLKWDLIGAPIDRKYGEGYNGGLSLRHIPTVLKVIQTFDWSETKDYEDQWFYKNMKKLPGAKLPSAEEAVKFSVETIWGERPLGYHQAQRWNTHRMPEIAQWCPEIHLCEEGKLYKS
ncbi:hypothetical protein DFJ77DRAFT_483388 [Powellomyces hirtus]|nr:hypothetical protein DFJ77DRAFT_483388 [Powellomyces hirtus]